jgi:hypothetical protein
LNPFSWRTGLLEEVMATTRKRVEKFDTTSILDVPHSRNGKHHDLIGFILGDLENLKPGMAMKIPLKELKSTKEKIRSALNRATAKKKISVATASDTSFLYIWKTDA